MQTNARGAMLAFLVLACCCGPGRAQEPEKAPPAALTPDQLLSDVDALALANRLQLTPAEAKKFLAGTQKVQEALQNATAVRARLYGERKDDFAAVRQAYVSRTEPLDQVVKRIDNAWSEARRADEAAAATAAQVETMLRESLTRSQAQMIETEAQRQVREQQALRFDGAPTPAAFVAQKLKEVHGLLPEEYAAQCTSLVKRIAQELGGNDSRRVAGLRDRVGKLLERVRQLSPQEWTAAQPTLESEVAKLLELKPERTAPAPPPAISLEEFRRFVRDPRAPAVLDEWLKRHAEEGKQP